MPHSARCIYGRSVTHVNRTNELQVGSLSNVLSSAEPPVAAGFCFTAVEVCAGMVDWTVATADWHCITVVASLVVVVVAVEQLVSEILVAEFISWLTIYDTITTSANLSVSRSIKLSTCNQSISQTAESIHQSFGQSVNQKDAYSVVVCNLWVL